MRTNFNVIITYKNGNPSQDILDFSLNKKYADSLSEKDFGKELFNVVPRKRIVVKFSVCQIGGEELTPALQKNNGKWYFN